MLVGAGLYMYDVS